MDKARGEAQRPGAPPRGAADPHWSAVLLAGQRQERDPLATHFGLASKALIPIDGEPMLARVVRTLLAAPSVGRVVILSQKPDELLQGELAWMSRDPRLSTAGGGDGISTSIAALAGTAAAPWPVLVTTADHPLLTPEMIEDFLARANASDLSVGVVERAVLHSRYPENRRTWLKFRGGAYTGANLFALRGPRAGAALTAWASVEANRKRALKLLWHFGPLLTLGALTRTLTLESAIAMAGRRLGLTAAAIPLPHADAAIDVDKLSDLELAEEIVRSRRQA